MTTPQAPVALRSRPVATGPMKARASGGLRRLAGQMKDAFPEMDVHQHLQDAARELDSGRTHSAQRHVNAAIFGLTPLQIRRHGVTDDAGHMRGKAFMQQAHRHLLLIKDIEDVHGDNRELRQQRRDDRDSQAQERAMRTAAPPASGQVAASWETHLHIIELVATPHHETAAGRKALKAKGQTAYGTSYPVPNVSYLHKALKAVGRVAPGKRGVLKRFLQKRAKQLGVSHHLKGTWADPGVKQMAAEIDLAAYGITDTWTLELTGPKGWSHGWVRAVGAGSATESIAGGLGTSLGSGKVSSGMHAQNRAFERAMEKRRKAQEPAVRAQRMASYKKLRAQGHSHNKALAVIRSIGRGFQAGAAVPPAGFANPSGPPPFVLSS
jgi:hypothetical protein